MISTTWKILVDRMSLFLWYVEINKKSRKKIGTVVLLYSWIMIIYHLTFENIEVSMLCMQFKLWTYPNKITKLEWLSVYILIVFWLSFFFSKQTFIFMYIKFFPTFGIFVLFITSKHSNNYSEIFEIKIKSTYSIT